MLLCIALLACVSIYALIFVPMRILRALRELIAETQAQTKILKQLAAPPGPQTTLSVTLEELQVQFDAGEINEAQFTRRRNAILAAGGQ